MKLHRIVLIALLVVSAVVLGACGGSDSTTTTTEATATMTDTAAAATTDTGMVTTGSAVCDDATLLAAAQEADSTVTKLAPGTKCADGWAVIFPVNADYEYTMVMQAEGQFWVYKKGIDCTTIPEVLQSLCETN